MTSTYFKKGCCNNYHTKKSYLVKKRYLQDTEKTLLCPRQPQQMKPSTNETLTL